MTDLAARGPLGLKEPPPPKKPRKAIPRESKKRKAYKASADGKAGFAHMARVAALRCVCCGYWPVEVHHCASDRYGQRKVADTETIPLCQIHHAEFHAAKETWEAEYGKDYHYLPVVADQLKGQWNDPWKGKR